MSAHASPIDDGVRVLASRRAYEFPLDSIWISALYTPEVTGAIQAAFGFGGAVNPPAFIGSFGPPVQSFPPPLAFNLGSFADASGRLIPIRALMFDQSRVILEVADSSDTIRTVFEYLRQVVEHAATGSRSVITGEPVLVQDQSDLTFPAWLSPAAVTSSPFLEAWLRFAPADVASWTPTVVLTAVGETGEFHGTGAGGAEFALQLRVGTSPEDCVVFSSAPLVSEAHHEYALALMSLLGRVPPAP